MTQSNHIKLLQQHLLKWYRKHQRKLPWRETKNSYFIWVSEVMLQQTRVETAIPYYQRFIQKFPTVNHLAQASEHDVLKQWQGLGYYRRARLIHQAAKEVAQNYNGHLPKTRDELQQLPGFGPYTSGAVASIAFNEAVPAVDGNVKRVLARIFATNDSIETIALEAAQVESPSEWTQALMELGALLCVPKNPKCLVCPIREICKAYELQKVDQYPVVSKKTKVKELFAETWMIKHPKKNQIMIQQREDSGRWANMWEFPTIESSQKPTTNKNNKLLPTQFDEFKKLGSFKHLLTHQTIHVDVMYAESPSQKLLQSRQKWVVLDELKDFPISKLQQRAFEIFKSKKAKVCEPEAH